MRICNEPLVYNFLFRTRLQGALYTDKMAQEFLVWAHNGWNDRTHYVFFLLDQGGRIHAALDIKCNQLECAEIGYWATATNPGGVTNAVSKLCRIANRAGYQSLLGLTLSENEKSAGVLLRNHFVETGIIERKGKFLRRFEKNLLTTLQ